MALAATLAGPWLSGVMPLPIPMPMSMPMPDPAPSTLPLGAISGLAVGSKRGV